MKPRSVLLRAGLVVALVAAAMVVPSAGVGASGGGRLRGVVENVSGEPLEGAQVRLSDAAGAVAATVVSDRDGRYVADVVPGTYDLAIDHGTGKGAKHAKVAAVAVGADTPLDIAIVGNSVRPSVFSGRLVDTAGRPLPFVDILAGGSTMTDEDGRFALAVRPDRYPLTLRIDAQDGDLHVYVPDFDLTSDRTVNWTVPVASVDVVVHDAAGRLMSWFLVQLGLPGTACSLCDGTVELFPGGPVGSWSTAAWTGDSGRVRLPALATTAAKISVEAYGWEPRKGTVAISAPSTAFDFEVRPTPPPAQLFQLQGTALDAAGHPLSSVTLEGEKDGTVAWAEIDAAGQYRLTAPPGTYTLRGSATQDNGDGEHEDWVNVDIELLRFKLDRDGLRQDLRTPGTTARVTVVDPAGAPVAAATVIGETRPTTIGGGDLYSGESRLATLAVVPTDANGVAVVPTIAGVPATYEVRPPAARGLDAKGKIPAGAADAQVRLTAGVRVEARLHNPDGSPRSVDHVRLRTTDGHQSTLLTATGNGIYVAQVPAARYLIDLDGNPDQEGESNDIEAWSIRDVAVDATGDTVLDLTIPADVRASRVRFVDSEGRPYDVGTSMAAATAPGAITLAPGMKGTGSAFASYMGESDTYRLPLVAPAIVTAEVNWPFDLKLSSLALSPGGDLVVAFPSGTTPLPPSAVTCLEGTATGPTTATIRWSAPADDFGSPVTGYLVTSDLENGDRAQRFLPSGVTSLDLTGLKANVRNFIVVEAVSVNGIGPISAFNLQSPDGSEAEPCPPPGAGPGGSGPGGSPPGGGGGSDPSGAGPHSPAGPGRSGYWALAKDGHVYNFGDAPALGHGAGNAVDLEPTPTGAGYWLLQANGRVSVFGDAIALGNVDTAKLTKGEEPASLSATPTGKGYWVFTNRGRALAFGDAAFLGDMSTTKLNGPVLGSVATPSGRGYYMVASDGGIFTFGDAVFAGSMGGQRLNAPVQGLVPDADGRGYWLVASDGGMFAFDAPFRGSMGGQKLNKPISGMVRYGDGYLMVGADGGIFNFSSRPFAGSLGDRPPASPIVAVATMP